MSNHISLVVEVMAGFGVMDVRCRQRLHADIARSDIYLVIGIPGLFAGPFRLFYHRFVEYTPVRPSLSAHAVKAGHGS